MSPSSELPQVDQRIWQACAGSSVRIPLVNSQVYFFAQGYGEQSSSASLPSLSPIALSKPVVACMVADVSFHADPITDEVFARLVLHPLVGPSGFPLPEIRPGGRVSAEDGDDAKISSFAKVLTSSDANNGGGFSVPRFCADTIFPQLNYQIDPPVQNLEVNDIHGVVWTFRHIYRGTPRRHLLTTGWSKFVNSKKLVAGDSVLFMKNSRGDMFVGIRRAIKFAAECPTWRHQIAARKTIIEEDSALKGSFARNGRGRVSPDSVVKAIEHAARGFPFEVVYYPRAGWSDFVVRTEVVEAAMRGCWPTGMRVKMAMETEDTSRITWFQGTISSTAIPENGPWVGSPWRMVQVAWDEPEILPNSRSVNPWQLEPLSIQSVFPPTKKLRTSMISGLGTNGGDRDTLFPILGLTRSSLGHLHPSLLDYTTTPAGMQGARQDAFGASGFLSYADENAHILLNADSLDNNTLPNSKASPTSLKLGNSQSENLSASTPNSGHSSGADLIPNGACDAPKASRNCIQLFGQLIYIEKFVESGSDDDGLKECTETANAGQSSASPPVELERLEDNCCDGSSTAAA
ncbi:hypothetical protein SAY87_028278 [Trapa incisa]|uniref:Auxin response factor n=1 Tax=Trapa incisa TaxID=236973 RepID=A0AAN7KVC6_9MYRT|nr:hypothetical protein SAY87_028278 [Trapa incisa]